MTRRRVFIVLTLVGNIAWFGGVLRLFAEAAARVLSAIRPDAIDETDLIVAGLGVALFVGVFVVLWPWYEKFDRQTQADMAALYGIPVDKMPTLGAAVQRAWKGLVVIVGGAILVALVLPGLVAAALAIGRRRPALGRGRHRRWFAVCGAGSPTATGSVTPISFPRGRSAHT